MTEIHLANGNTRRYVSVPTETGGEACLEFEMEYPGVWTIRLAASLVEDHLESIHAVLGLALMKMRDEPDYVSTESTPEEQG